MAQKMAQNVIVGGDFRSLLNALSNIYETALARHLPFRVGATGLHFIEGLAHAVRAQPLPVRAALRKQLRDPLSQTERDLASRITGGQIDYALAALTDRAAVLSKWFRDDCRALEQQLAAGEAPSRLVVVLDEPAVEVVVADLLRSTFGMTPTSSAGGWINRLINWRKKA